MKAVCDRAELDLIREMVREWVRLLASRRFADAAEYLTPVPGLDLEYTADRIKEALGMYSRQYREAPEQERERYVPSVSDPDKVDAPGECMVIFLRTDKGKARIDYDLPIDGTWSDLTAQFILLAVEGGYALGLWDLHAL
jgi:hypothetical protein